MDSFNFRSFIPFMLDLKNVCLFSLNSFFNILSLSYLSPFRSSLHFFQCLLYFTVLVFGLNIALPIIYTGSEELCFKTSYVADLGSTVVIALIYSSTRN